MDKPIIGMLVKSLWESSAVKGKPARITHIDPLWFSGSSSWQMTITLIENNAMFSCNADEVELMTEHEQAYYQDQKRRREHAMKYL